MRKINFSAGPAAIPEAVLTQLQAEFLEWQGQGASIVEMPHRAEAALNLVEETTQLFRRLLKIPKQFQILFMHGGARMQFSAIPMNLLGKSPKAVYLNTGYWSEAAAAEARRYGDVKQIPSSRQISFPECASGTYVPLYHWPGAVYLSQSRRPSDTCRENLFDGALDALPSKDTVYLHYCDNETISGIEFPEPPLVEHIPLVSDMSSNILSKPLDWQPFGLVYAGMQKNLGVAGLSVVVVREDLLDQAQPITPSVLHYKTQVARHSAYNTLPLFNIYAASLVLKWLDQQGGVEVIQQINQRKAAKVYALIDQFPMYQVCVDKAWRSMMNITFSLPTKALEEQFIAQAKQHRLINLEGHGSVGGVRASLYNALSEQDVDQLVDFMKAFAQQYEETL